MATTDKSIKQLNSNGLNVQSSTSKAPDSDGSCISGDSHIEQLPWLVPGKLYYTKQIGYNWSFEEPDLELVQFVCLMELKPGQDRDADPMQWICKCYLIEGSQSTIPITFIKAKDLLDKEFVEGSLYECLG